MDNDVVAATGIPEEERKLLLIVYILYGLGLLGVGLTSIAAVVINHIKVGEVTTEFSRSHHVWLMRTFWWSLLWGAISFVLTFVVIGVVGFFLLFVWYVYRLVRGIINFTENRPMPV